MGTDGGTHHMSWMQLKMRVVAAAWLRSDWWWLLRYHRNHHRGSYPYRRFPSASACLLFVHRWYWRIRLSFRINVAVAVVGPIGVGRRTKTGA